MTENARVNPDNIIGIEMCHTAQPTPKHRIQAKMHSRLRCIIMQQPIIKQLQHEVFPGEMTQGMKFKKAEGQEGIYKK